MRIIGGAWRGRTLAAPAGQVTRPTAERMRQALFDMLLHAPWAGPDSVRGARVLDAFAGTGALGLEALSRGAAEAVFVEQDRAALAALRANIATCRATSARVIAGDATAPWPAGPMFKLVFLDPPYGRGMVGQALQALAGSGRIGEATLALAELARDEPFPAFAAHIVAERQHGAARLVIFRPGSAGP